ncbi:SulP family inorganic anion transporter [Solirubrobacter phytolaccae]|uniref:SulP family inorganic anion transporter n=1 Tax=Solirubrobacter phytolaccae TaxID=1404360 RepID=A0A9X3SHR5_9ACTN|nr:SulP family inorganic anion transporter [Solirubrobacter phytolaccae]MDA0183422.1 SulP family inorganic anion transporter [Solirubrobacter phytolaccae]
MRKDALAGVATAAVVIPQSMAYATIAGLPVEVGLYTALVPLLVYALLGTSRALSVSTTSTLAALTGAAVATVPPDQAMAATTTLALLAGGLLLAAGVLRLGFLADFISHPVLAGFKAGTGLLIAAGQLGKVLGVEQTGDSFFAKTRSALSHLGDISWPTAALAAATVAGLFALKRTKIPGALVAVGAGIVVGAAGLLDVALTGTVPGGLPTPAAPDLGLIGPLLPAAAGIALMSFVESIAAGRAIAHSDEPEPNADRELIALGAANFAGGVFRSLPAGGGLSQTAVNDTAETKRAGALTALVTLATLLFLTSVFADLPQATLGALVLVSAVGLIQLEPFRQIGEIHRRGVALGLLTMLGVLTLGVLQGVLVGVLASMLSLVHALNHPQVTRLETGEIKVVGPLYFANVQRVKRRVLELDPEPVLDMSAVHGIDVTAALVLEELAPRMQGLNPQPRELLRRVQSRANAAANSRSTSK